MSPVPPALLLVLSNLGRVRSQSIHPAPVNVTQLPQGHEENPALFHLESTRHRRRSCRQVIYRHHRRRSIQQQQQRPSNNHTTLSTHNSTTSPFLPRICFNSSGNKRTTIHNNNSTALVRSSSSNNIFTTLQRLIDSWKNFFTLASASMYVACLIAVIMFFLTILLALFTCVLLIIECASLYRRRARVGYHNPNTSGAASL